MGLADIEDLVDNILYVCDRVEVDHVGIDSDFPRIADRLSRRGLAEQEVMKILGGNFLRVFKRVVGT